MKIKLTSIFVDDQEKALQFYTRVLGFVKKYDMPVGNFRWLTVVSPDEPDGTELVLEPSDNPAVPPFKKALYKQGIPFTAFRVENLQAEFERLQKQGVRFTIPPMDGGPIKMAVFDDTCGNLVQIFEPKA